MRCVRMSRSARAAPRVRESQRVPVAADHAVLLEAVQVVAAETPLQGVAQQLHRGGPALAQLPEPLEHLVAVGDPVHSPSAPAAAARTARTAPV